MRLFLFSDSKTGINFFPMLEELLHKKIADLQVETIFVPFPEDLPAKAAAVAAESDLAFVFVLYQEKDFKIEALLNKLIDLEMQKGMKIIKAIEESELENFNEVQLEEEKDRLAEKWSEFIINYLFKPETFAPKQERREPGLFT